MLLLSIWSSELDYWYNHKKIFSFWRFECIFTNLLSLLTCPPIHRGGSVLFLWEFFQNSRVATTTITRERAQCQSQVCVWLKSFSSNLEHSFVTQFHSYIGIKVKDKALSDKPNWWWWSGDGPLVEKLIKYEFNVVFYILKENLMNKVSYFIVNQMFIIIKWYFLYHLSLIHHSSLEQRRVKTISSDDSPVSHDLPTYKQWWCPWRLVMLIIFYEMFISTFILLRDPVYP